MGPKSIAVLLQLPLFLNLMLMENFLMMGPLRILQSVHANLWSQSSQPLSRLPISMRSTPKPGPRLASRSSPRDLLSVSPSSLPWPLSLSEHVCSFNDEQFEIYT